MILNDLEDLKQNNYVVIIGSGPAGISVALQLEKKGISSVIIEAGDIDFKEKSQSLYDGTIIGESYPDLKISLRQFGGTSGHWGGNCVEMDNYDFKWPIKKLIWSLTKNRLRYIKYKGKFLQKSFNEDLDLFNLNWSNVRFKDKYYQKIKVQKK